MTDPGATDADRQEQQRLTTPAQPELAGEVTAPADDVPEADAIEQQLAAVRGSTGGTRDTTVEADEFDVLEQQAAVPVDEDDVRD
jgi:hypothetical protein